MFSPNGGEVSGVSAEQTSQAAVFKGQMTRLENGNAANTALKTVGKGVSSGIIGGSTRAGTNILVDQSGVKDTVTAPLDKILTGVGEQVCQCEIKED